MLKTLIGILLKVNFAAAFSTHSQIADEKTFPQIPMLCSEFSQLRAAATATTPETILTAAHLFFDEGPWLGILNNPGNYIKREHYFEISGEHLKLPLLQAAYLNLEYKKIRRIFVPIGWIPFPDDNIPKPKTADGVPYEKPMQDYDLAVVEFYEGHGLPTLQLNLGNRVEGPYKIVGFGPNKVSFEGSVRDTNVCAKPMMQKRVSETKEIQSFYTNWEIEADDEHGDPNKPGTTKGDSGGPLLDKNNRVIGVASSIRPTSDYHKFVNESAGEPKMVHSYISTFMRLGHPRIRNFLVSVYETIESDRKNRVFSQAQKIH